MKKEYLKKRVKNQFNRIKNRVWVIPTALVMNTKVFAKGSINTAEVNQATDNVINAVTKLAIPIRNNDSFCKYCYNINENDSKF